MEAVKIQFTKTKQSYICVYSLFCKTKIDINIRRNGQIYNFDETFLTYLPYNQ